MRHVYYEETGVARRLPEEVDLSAHVSRLIRGLGAPVHDSRVAQALSSAPGFRALDDGAHA